MSLKSNTQLASEFCMNAAGQKVRQRPATPTDDERLLRARLIFEEALETIYALGCEVHDFSGQKITAKDDESYEIFVGPGQTFDLVESIDGCCDLNVVTAGTLSCIGVPDRPFQDEVNRANAAKFPDGVGVPHPDVPGKFGKPDGWLPPNHVAVLQKLSTGELESETVL